MKVAIVFAAFFAAVLADDPTQTKKGVEEPSAAPTLNVQVVQGCFSSAGDMKKIGPVEWNSKDSCAKGTCMAQGYKVAATTQGNLCYCGNSYPPRQNKVDDSKCNIGCAGYDLQACGGYTTFTVYNTGLALLVDGDNPEADTDDDQTSSSSSSSSSAPVSQATAVVTVSGSTTVVTQTSSPSNNEDNSGGGGGSKTNVAGIAAGVVVGVVALAGLAGLAWFLIRRRRNQDIEEEHRRNAAVNAFINGSKPPGSSGGLSVSDSRLDPVMAQRRMSSGSIADNEDYSRRILRVTNA